MSRPSPLHSFASPGAQPPRRLCRPVPHTGGRAGRAAALDPGAHAGLTTSRRLPHGQAHQHEEGKEGGDQGAPAARRCRRSSLALLCTSLTSLHPLPARQVIGYIASHFRKDKIWLRRTRPDKRRYQVGLVPLCAHVWYCFIFFCVARVAGGLRIMLAAQSPSPQASLPAPTQPTALPTLHRRWWWRLMTRAPWPKRAAGPLRSRRWR